MTINELIAKLEKMRADYGDVQVEVRRDDGFFGFVTLVGITHYGRPSPPNSEPTQVVYLDV
jgi:hypothetical protein